MNRKPGRTHFRSIRLFNNGGITFPLCHAVKPGPLDMDKTRLPINAEIDRVDCRRCLELAAREGIRPGPRFIHTCHYPGYSGDGCPGCKPRSAVPR